MPGLRAGNRAAGRGTTSSSDPAATRARISILSEGSRQAGRIGTVTVSAPWSRHVAGLSRDDFSHIGRSWPLPPPTGVKSLAPGAGTRLAHSSIAVVPGVDETSADFLPAHGAHFTDWRPGGPSPGPSYDARNAALLFPGFWPSRAGGRRISSANSARRQRPPAAGAVRDGPDGPLTNILVISKVIACR